MPAARIGALAWLAAAATAAVAAPIATCDQRIAIAGTSENRVEVVAAAGMPRPISPAFFGFNLEWVDFQQDLWDGARRAVRPEIIDHLKAFPGAVYRYPGGTGSNHIDWRETTGNNEKRPVRNHVDWLGPIRPEFGFDEYLDFVAQVGGQAWVVANLYGTRGKESEIGPLANAAGEWAAYAHRAAQDGRPRILRWELGNELDRGNTLWPPGKYAARAGAVADAIRKREADAGFVSMMQDWPAQRAQGLSVSGYNSTVMRGTARVTSEFAHHLYYEEMSWDAVQKRVGLICRSIEDANASGILNPVFWVTEHARGLPGNAGSPEWKRSWPKTANLEAGLIAAEAYITATQLPELRGLFLHSLGTSHGPWPLFNATRQGSVHPSAVYWSLYLLRASMKAVALPSRVHSRNDGQTFGKNDVRAAVLTDDARSSYSIWAVNRAHNASDLRIKVPELAGRSMNAEVMSLSDENKDANNYASASRILPKRGTAALEFGADGTARTILPPHSVVTLQFKAPR